MPFSKESSQPKDQTQVFCVSCTAGGFFITEPPGRNANQNHAEMSSHTVRIAIIRKSTNKKCWRWCGEKEILIHFEWECKLVHPLWRFLKKLNTELPYDPAISLLSIYPEKTII